MKRILIWMAFLIAGCSKNTIETNGTVQNFTGLDGCGMMIVLDSGERLEPVSVPAGTTLQAGRRVRIEYRVVQRVSICMAGTTAEITSLQYL
jgi:hypothetical protein